MAALTPRYRRGTTVTVDCSSHCSFRRCFQCLWAYASTATTHHHLLPPPPPQTGKEPWDSYKNLEAAGVEIVWADLGAGMPSLTGEFEFVFDNWSKDADLAKPYVEAAKSWGVSNYVFVSSAGMYSGKGSLKESDDVKETENLRAKNNIDDNDVKGPENILAACETQLWPHAHYETLVSEIPEIERRSKMCSRTWRRS